MRITGRAAPHVASAVTKGDLREGVRETEVPGEHGGVEKRVLGGRRVAGPDLRLSQGEQQLASLGVVVADYAERRLVQARGFFVGVQSPGVIAGAARELDPLRVVLAGERVVGALGERSVVSERGE